MAAVVVILLFAMTYNTLSSGFDNYDIGSIGAGLRITVKNGQFESS